MGSLGHRPLRTFFMHLVVKECSQKRKEVGGRKKEKKERKGKERGERD